MLAFFFLADEHTSEPGVTSSGFRVSGDSIAHATSSKSSFFNER
jgi:hypothetical protein